ncbi:MAG: DUF1761 domain-containing protein [Longimicrobiales bacterium]
MDSPTMMASINWLGVLLAVLASFALGFLWYGPLFGKTWMAASGVNADKAQSGNMAMIFGTTAVLQLIAAAVLSMFIGPDPELSYAIMAGFAVGAFWIATSLGTTYLYEQRPFAHWAVNASYNVVTYTVWGLIFALL